MTWYVALNSFPQLIYNEKSSVCLLIKYSFCFLAISKLFVMFTVFRFDKERKNTFLRAFTNIMLFSSLLLHEQSVNAFYRVTY